jgi:hypothetical protein
MYPQASNTNHGPVLVTITAPHCRTHRRRAVVSTLIKVLDSQDVEGRPDPASPWAYLDGNNIVVQVHPGVSSVGAVRKMVRRAIPTARFFSAVPLSVSGLITS